MQAAQFEGITLATKVKITHSTGFFSSHLASYQQPPNGRFHSITIARDLQNHYFRLIISFINIKYTFQKSHGHLRDQNFNFIQKHVIIYNLFLI